MNRGCITVSYGVALRKVLAEARFVGSELLVVVNNDNAHIGAVALAEYDDQTGRASTSVLTRVSHKDDVVAVSAAYHLAKAMRRSVCVVAGIHIDNACAEDIEVTQQNAETAVKMLVERVSWARDERR